MSDETMAPPPQKRIEQPGRRRMLLQLALAAAAAGGASLWRSTDHAAAAITVNLDESNLGSSMTSIESDFSTAGAGDIAAFQAEARNPSGGTGVYGLADFAPGDGVFGESRASGNGVRGLTETGAGVRGEATQAGGVALHAVASGGAKGLVVDGGATELNGAVTTAGAALFKDQVTALRFQGAGHLLTFLNATNMTLGTLPDARLSANIPRLNTGIPAAALPATVPFTDKPNNTFKGQVIARVFAGAPRSGGAPAFSKAGTATIAKGQDRVTVATSALKRGVSVLATLQGSPGRGIAVECVEKHAGAFDIVLTAPAKAKTEVAYFLFRQG